MEVVEALLSVISTKNYKGIIDHGSGMKRSRAGRDPPRRPRAGLNDSPSTIRTRLGWGTGGLGVAFVTPLRGSC